MQVTKLKKRREYLSFGMNCTKLVLPSMIILLKETEVEGNVAVGYTASKKVGNAVCRNFAKRRMKAVFDEVVKGNDSFELPKHQGYMMNWIARPYILKRDYSKMVRETQKALTDFFKSAGDV
ncbi:MAG: hypothetical protein CMF61_05280 [Magnetococcales bacterium]|nr:hypothetical protein [Magnetococcales bacterium]PPR17289.1 MAG: Ribonuclease P protein component [Pseudomonadota bacterium]